MSVEYDISMRVTFEKLGLALHDIPEWFCCGASSAHMTDASLSDALAAKNLALASHIADQIVVPCAACFHRLGTTNYKLKDDEEFCATINEQIKGQYQGNAQVIHPLQVIAEKFDKDQLSEMLIKPLSGLKVASYYGCLLLRPAEIAIDDQENPTIMDDLVSSLGGEPIDWGFKVECCGGGMTLAHKETVIGLGQRIIEDAQLNNADCIMVACPMCHANLDIYQEQMKLNNSTPILYFTELLGLAIGIEDKNMAIDRHIISATDLLKKRGLIDG